MVYILYSQWHCEEGKYLCFTERIISLERFRNSYKVSQSWKVVELVLQPFFFFASKSSFPGSGLTLPCYKLDCSTKDDTWLFLIHTVSTPSRKLSRVSQLFIWLVKNFYFRFSACI